MEKYIELEIEKVKINPKLLYVLEKKELDYKGLSFQQKKILFYKSEVWKLCKTLYKKSVSQRYRRTCVCCGRKGLKDFNLHIDHIVPLSKDWSKRLDLSNLQILCASCNIGKSNNDTIRFSNVDKNQKDIKKKEYASNYKSKMNTLFS